MKQARLVKDACELVRLEVADRWWLRMVGLLGRSELPPGRGLLLSPATSIHTFGMRFPLDLIFLDRRGRIVNIVRNVVPWRTAFGGKGAYRVIEMATGWFDWSRLTTGDQTTIDPMPGQ